MRSHPARSLFVEETEEATVTAPLTTRDRSGGAQARMLGKHAVTWRRGRGRGAGSL